MRRSAAVITIASLLIIGAPARADDQLLYTYFADFLDALRTQAGIPGLAAAIVKLDDSVWEGTFGQRNVELSLPMQPYYPFQVDGLTQIVTASLVLKCVDEGRLSLDDRIGQFKPDSPYADATIRQVLTHTWGPPDNLTFSYQPQRYEPLANVIAKCRSASYRETVANLLDRFAMADSVPGLDAGSLVPAIEGFPTPQEVARYNDVLKNLATPYAVNSQRRASPSQYTTPTLTAFSGLISTVRDLAKFDVALRDAGAIVSHDLLADAWRPPVDQNGHPLPHAQGWFAQTYKGKPIVWQIGASENVSSSMILKVPSLGTTLILAANSDGLVKPFPLSAGDATVSPFARVFLALFAR